MIAYIKEYREVSILYKFLNKLKMEEKNNKMIIQIPSCKERKLKKLIKHLNKNRIKNIVLSKQLSCDETIKEILINNNIQILSGTYIFNFLILDIIEKIYNYKKKKIETGEITILVNEESKINIDNIAQIAEKVKRLNILTNNINRLEKISEYLYNELGILIKLSNNLKTNIKSSDIILNIDFSEELINKLDIPQKTVIVSVFNEISIYSKKFAGINIKNIELNIPEQYTINGFDDNIVYEAYLISEHKKDIYNQIKKDNIKIKELLGINGKIDRSEFV